MWYCIADKFGIFGESSVIHKLKPSKLVVTNINLLANLFICQTFFNKVLVHPVSPNIIATKFSQYMVYCILSCY